MRYRLSLLALVIVLGLVLGAALGAVIVLLEPDDRAAVATAPVRKARVRR